MTAGMSVRDVVRAHYGTRFGGDVLAAAALIPGCFVFRSPFITSHSPDGHLDGLEGLLGIVTGVDLISEPYGENDAASVYDIHTVESVGITRRTAEHLRLDAAPVGQGKRGERGSTAVTEGRRISRECELRPDDRCGAHLPSPLLQSSLGQSQPSWRNMPRRSLTARISATRPARTVKIQICSTSQRRPVGSGIRG